MSPERTVYLIDTPGFDGTNKNDTEVLSEVATWLADSYQSKIRLHGIIFLHRITDNRLQGSAKRTLAILRKLCGPDALKRVVLVTTMSNKAAEEEAVVARGKLLTNTDDLWGGMLSQGSSCYRHDNTASTAKAIVNLLASHDEPVATDLQRQLVDEHQPLDETGAGRVLDAEMAREKDAWKQERLQMQQDTERAIKERDQIEDQTRRDERDKYTARIELMVENNNRLHSTMERLLADREQRVGRLETELREQRAAHMAEIKRLKSDAQRREEQAVLLATTDRERQGQREEIDELRRQVEQLTTAAGSGTREETEDVNGQDSFCFALNGNLAVCLNLGGIHGAWMSEKAKRTGSGRLQAVSFGVASGGGIVWIGKYSDGTWRMYPFADSFASATTTSGEINSPTLRQRYRIGDTIPGFGQEAQGSRARQLGILRTGPRLLLLRTLEKRPHLLGGPSRAQQVPDRDGHMAQPWQDKGSGIWAWRCLRRCVLRDRASSACLPLPISARRLPRFGYVPQQGENQGHLS